MKEMSPSSSTTFQPKIGKAEDIKASKEEEEKIRTMTVEVTQLKNRVSQLQSQNSALKSQIDELTNDVKDLMK